MKKLLIIFIFISTTLYSQKINFEGEGITIERVGEDHKYFIKSGTLTSSDFTINGVNFDIIVYKNGDFNLMTRNKVYYTGSDTLLIDSTGMQYSSIGEKGEFYGPVNIKKDNWKIISKDKVYIRKRNKLSGSTFVFFDNDDAQMNGKNFRYENDILYIDSELEMKKGEDLLTGNEGIYKTKKKELFISKNGHYSSSDTKISFDNGYHSQDGRSELNDFILEKDKMILRAGLFKGLIKEGVIDDVLIEKNPELILGDINIYCDRIIGKDDIFRFRETPRSVIRSDTFILTLYHEELYLDRSINTVFGKDRNWGQDNEGNIYFCRDLKIYEDETFSVEHGFYLYNDEVLISSERLRGDSKSFMLYDNGYAYHSEDETEFFFREAIIEDISTKIIKSPYMNFNRKDGHGDAGRVIIKYGEKLFKGEDLRYNLTDERLLVNCTEFISFDNKLIFPSGAAISFLQEFSDELDIDHGKKDNIYTEKGYYDLKSKEIFAGNIRTVHNEWYIRSDYIKVIDPATFYLFNAVATTCDQFDPHYYFKVKKLKMIKNDKLVFNGATYNMGKLPILYLPFYVKNIDPDPGPIVTYLGRDNYMGYFIKNKILFRPKFPNFRLKFNLLIDYMTERDIGAGYEMRYSHKNGSGNSFYYFNRDWDNIFEGGSSYRDLSKFNAQFNQNLVKFKVIGRFDNSNTTMINRYFSDFEAQIDQREYISNLSISHDSSKLFFFSTSYNKRTYNYNEYTSTNETFPDIRLNIKNQNLGFIRFALNSNYHIRNELDRGSGNALINIRSLNLRYLNINTGVSPGFLFTTNTMNEKPEIFIYIPFNITLSSTAYRVFDLHNIQLKHTIIPTVNFSYSSPVLLPQKDNFLSNNPLYFYEKPVRSLRFSINNRFSTRKDQKIVNLGYINIGSSYDFKLNKVPNVSVLASFQPLRLNLSMNYDIIRSEIVNMNMSFSTHLTKYIAFYSLLTYNDYFSQTFNIVFSRKNLTVRLNLSYNYYDAFEYRFPKKQVEVVFPMHCYIFKLTYQNQQFKNATTINKFLFSVQIGKLKGTDMKIEADIKDEILNVMGQREAMPM